jgi:TrwC relaxase
MPEELRRSLSKRHEQITAELERQEASGKHRTAKLVQHVVHATRLPKSHETPETLYGRWQQEARDLGYEPERLVRDLTTPTRDRDQQLVGTAGPDDASPAALPGGTAGHWEHSGETAGQSAGLPERTISQVFDRLAGP